MVSGISERIVFCAAIQWTMEDSFSDQAMMLHALGFEQEGCAANYAWVRS